MKNSPNKLCTLLFSEFLDSQSFSLLHLSLEVDAIEASSQSWADERSMGALLVSSSAMTTSVDDEVGNGEDAPAGSSSSSTTVPSSAKFNTRRKGDILQYQ